MNEEKKKQYHAEYSREYRLAGFGRLVDKKYNERNREKRKALVKKWREEQRQKKRRETD